MNDRLVSLADLSATDEEAMFELLCKHFNGVSRTQFAQDLAGKNWVLLLENAEGRLLGFSTMHFSPAVLAGSTVNVVFSGDTIVDPSAWGTPSLFESWISAVFRLNEATPQTPLYWLLIVSGFRTYRLLPLFWREFWPRHDRAMTPRAKLLLDGLAQERFGGDFDAATGIVRFSRPQVLREELRAVPKGRLENPHIKYFLTRNPGHVRGDELVCLCELSETNLSSAGKRMVQLGARRNAVET